MPNETLRRLDSEIIALLNKHAREATPQALDDALTGVFSEIFKPLNDDDQKGLFKAFSKSCHPDIAHSAIKFQSQFILSLDTIQKINTALGAKAGLFKIISTVRNKPTASADNFSHDEMIRFHLLIALEEMKQKTAVLIKVRGAFKDGLPLTYPTRNPEAYCRYQIRLSLWQILYCDSRDFNEGNHRKGIQRLATNEQTQRQFEMLQKLFGGDLILLEQYGFNIDQIALLNSVFTSQPNNSLLTELATIHKWGAKVFIPSPFVIHEKLIPQPENAPIPDPLPAPRYSQHYMDVTNDYCLSPEDGLVKLSLSNALTEMAKEFPIDSRTQSKQVTVKGGVNKNGKPFIYPSTNVNDYFCYQIRCSLSAILYADNTSSHQQYTLLRSLFDKTPSDSDAAYAQLLARYSLTVENIKQFQKVLKTANGNDDESQPYNWLQYETDLLYLRGNNPIPWPWVIVTDHRTYPARKYSTTESWEAVNHEAYDEQEKAALKAQPQWKKFQRFSKEARKTINGIPILFMATLFFVGCFLALRYPYSVTHHAYRVSGRVVRESVTINNAMPTLIAGLSMFISTLYMGLSAATQFFYLACKDGLHELSTVSKAIALPPASAYREVMAPLKRIIYSPVDDYYTGFHRRILQVLYPVRIITGLFLAGTILSSKVTLAVKKQIYIGYLAAANLYFDYPDHLRGLRDFVLWPFAGKPAQAPAKSSPITDPEQTLLDVPGKQKLLMFSEQAASPAVPATHAATAEPRASTRVKLNT